jgi:hypothetical protein
MPLNLETIYCGPPCGKVCFPFTHEGSLTFAWSVDEESFLYSKRFEGEVCIPFFFPDEGVSVQVSGDGFETVEYYVEPNGVCGQEEWTQLIISGENEMIITL